MQSNSAKAGSNFNCTLEKLITLTQVELRRLFIFLSCAIVCICSAVTFLLLSIFPGIQFSSRVLTQSQITLLLLSVSAALLLTSVRLFHLAKRSALRLQTVIQPNQISFTMRNSGVSELVSRSNPSKEQISAKNHSSKPLPDISQDLLPRTATKFYSLINNAKNSFFQSFDFAVKPVQALKSFAQTKPVLTICLAAITGMLLSALFFRRTGSEDINSVSKNQQRSTTAYGADLSSVGSRFSALTNLAMMAATFGIQLFLKEMIGHKDSNLLHKDIQQDKQKISPNTHVITPDLQTRTQGLPDNLH